LTNIRPPAHDVSLLEAEKVVDVPEFKGNNTKADGTTEKSFQVAAPTISLPKGNWAIRSMGEKFAANPVTGTGSMTVPITTSSGRSGFGPQLTPSYDSAAGIDEQDGLKGYLLAFDLHSNDNITRWHGRDNQGDICDPTDNTRRFSWLISGVDRR
jgi:Salmonella virulence plasmid 65kDa B protein